MYRHSAKVLRMAFVLAASAVVSSPSFGAMGLPGGDVWGNGDFSELGYGATGMAYVAAFLYVDGITQGPQAQAMATNLTYNYAYGFSGAGNSQFTVSYSIRNDDPAPFPDLRFIVNVQPDGSASYDDIAARNPADPDPWAAAAGGEPDRYQIVDWNDDLKGSIATNNGLTNTDACAGAVCDVDFALQWNLASLEPGLIWNVTVLLSDDGSTLSSRHLSAFSVDTTGTTLTFSGTAAVVPLPPAWLLLMAAVGSLGLAGRRRAGGR